MKLTDKQINYIKRHAGTKSPDALARKLRVEVGEVERVLGLGRQRRRQELAASLGWLLDRGLAVLPLIAPLTFIRGIYDFANLPQLALIQCGTIFLLLLWGGEGVLAGRWRVRKSPFYWPLLFFLLWSLAAVFYGHNRYEGLLTWLGWAAPFVFFFLVCNRAHRPGVATRIQAAVFLAGLLVVLLGIGQHLLGIDWVPQVVKPAATFANRNMATHFVVLALPLGFLFLFKSSGKGASWFLSLALALQLAFLTYTQTRAGWLAVSVEFLVLTGFMVREYLLAGSADFWNRRKTLAAAGAFLVLIVMINLGGSLDDVMKRAASITGEVTAAKQQEGYSSIFLRLDIWQNTLFGMVQDRPLAGFGLGNHKVYYPLYFRKVVKEKVFSEAMQLANVHNDYLQILAETGFVGLGFLGWLAVVLGLTIRRLSGRGPPREVRLAVIAISMAVAGLMVNAFFSFPMQRAVPPLILMIYLGLLGSWAAGEDDVYEFRSRPFMVVGTILTAVISVVMLVGHYRAISCDRHYLAITGLEKAGNWDGVIFEGRQAHQDNPWRAKIMSYIGRAQVESGRHREAVASLNQVIGAYPNHINALLNIGVAYSKMGEFEAARQSYEKVLAIIPDYAKVHNNLANLYMQQARVDEAFVEFEKAAALDPENHLIQFNIGIVEMRRQRYQAAARAFERALELEPGFARAHKSLGGLYFQFLGQRPTGLAHFRKALELDPEIANAAAIRSLLKQAAARD